MSDLDRDNWWKSIVYLVNNELSDHEKDKFFKNFYKLPQWKELKEQVLSEQNTGYCPNCRVIYSFENGCDPNVDHILPIRYFFEKALDYDNLQLLCSQCNRIKGNAFKDRAVSKLFEAKLLREDPDLDSHELSKRKILYEIDRDMERLGRKKEKKSKPYLFNTTSHKNSTPSKNDKPISKTQIRKQKRQASIDRKNDLIVQQNLRDMEEYYLSLSEKDKSAKQYNNARYFIDKTTGVLTRDN